MASARRNSSGPCKMYSIKKIRATRRSPLLAPESAAQPDAMYGHAAALAALDAEHPRFADERRGGNVFLNAQAQRQCKNERDRRRHDNARQLRRAVLAITGQPCGNARQHTRRRKVGTAIGMNDQPTVAGAQAA